MFKALLSGFKDYSNQLFGGTIDLMVSMLGYLVLTGGIDFFTEANMWADLVITWGMAIIVGYGVLKIFFGIIWYVLFAKKFEMKIGLLEKFYKILKPVRVQSLIETTEEDEHKKTLEYVERIEKTRNAFKPKTRRCLVMNVKKILDAVIANKWTIIGTGAVAVAGVLQGFGVIEPVSAELIGKVLEGDPAALITTAGTLAVGGLGLNAALGKGIETPEQYKARLDAQLKAKEAKLAAQANGVDEVAAKKLAKQLGIDEAQAKVVLKAKADKKAAALREQVAKKEDAIIEALAKKLGVDKEQARVIRKAQLAKVAQK